MPLSYFVVAVIFALVVIGLLIVLIVRRPGGATEAEMASLREERSDLQRRLAVEEQKAARVTVLEKQAESLSEARSAAERQLATASATLASKSELVDDFTNRLDQALAARDSARQEVSELRSQLATLQETLDQERKQAEKSIVLLADARERMTQEFKILAAEVMKSHGETFSKQNREQLDLLLAPLQQKLGEFQAGLQAAHTESAKERGALAEQIRSLSEQSARMTLETSSLTRALKGESQTQGAWGEMILTSILERSGLREGEEYVAQQSHTTDEGNRVRPDVVVNLPGGQKIIVDSKLSLVAFNDFVNAATDSERAAHLKRHLISLREHIRKLSGKEYHTAAGSQLDYVVMFVPIEGALAAALQEDPSLTSAAVAANVAIATPTTLMIALRTVANVWQVERRNKNAEDIANRAGRIYDKFVGFIEDMDELGSRLTQARTTYETAMGKLSSGRGNLVNQVGQLKELGAKTSKTLQTGLFDAGEDEPALVNESDPAQAKTSASGSL